MPVIGKAAPRRAGHHPDRRRLGLQRSRLAGWLQGQSEGRSRRAVRRRRRRRLRPGDLRLRAAPERRQALGWSTSTPTKARLGWLAGYCHPIRFNDLAARKVIPADLLAKLPDPALYAKAVFPTLDEQDAAKADDHQGLGLGRRRQCPIVTDTIVANNAAPASAGVAASGRRRLPRFAGMRWGDYLGVAPFLIFAILFLIVPTLVPGRRRLPGAATAASRLQNIIDLGTPQIVSSFWISIRVSAASAAARRAVRPAHRARHHPRPPAARHPLDGDDLLGRRLQFRRHPAGLRLRRDARPRSAWSRSCCKTASASTSTAPASTC